MAEYIEREALLKQIDETKPENWMNSDAEIQEEIDYACYRGLVSTAHAADVAPVRHGKWVDKPTGAYRRMQSWCSACGKHSGIGGIESNRHKPYCPNCGAKMDGKEEYAVENDKSGVKFKLAKDLVSGDVFEYDGQTCVVIDDGSINGCMWVTDERYYINPDNNPRGLVYGYTNACVIAIDDSEVVEVIRNINV